MQHFQLTPASSCWSDSVGVHCVGICARFCTRTNEKRWGWTL